MKKSTILVLVFTLVFGVSSLMMASEIQPDVCEPVCGPMSGELNITAKVPVYGEVNMPNKSVHLEFLCGKDNESKMGSAEFTIRSNAYMNVTAGLDALRYTIGNEVNRISTKAEIKEKKTSRWGGVSWEDFITVETKDFKSIGKNMPGTTGSGKGLRNYKVDITGKLGQIEDQAAGLYKGNLKITLAARP